MKEDILEQLVDDYLQMQHYFTRHNLKFKPSKDHPEFVSRDDSNDSDVDVIGYNPLRHGADQVWVVSCKSWLTGFSVQSKINQIEQHKIVNGREAWKAFRELLIPKWSEAFIEAVYLETGTRKFTYVTAVTKVVGDRRLWEQHDGFRRALKGNPIRLLTLDDIIAEVLPNINTATATSELGRTIQLLKATGLLRTEGV